MGSTNSSLRKSRAPVDILDDDWLETLRSLSFRQWSKVRLVSRQLNGVAQRNVSILPCAIINCHRERFFVWNQMLSNMPATDAIQWLKDCNIALDIPKGIQLNNAIIGINLEEHRCVNICLRGSGFAFYAEFGPSRNENFWASMAYFLKFFYRPGTYVKESLSWVEKNVRAETIDFSLVMETISQEEICNFYFDSSWKCAMLETIKLGKFACSILIKFLDVLVKKFHTIPLVESAIPTLSCYMYREGLEKLPAHLGPNLIAQEVDSEGAAALYMISNGQNRMRISFCRWPYVWSGFVKCRVRIYSV